MIDIDISRPSRYTNPYLASAGCTASAVALLTRARPWTPWTACLRRLMTPANPRSSNLVRNVCQTGGASCDPKILYFETSVLLCPFSPLTEIILIAIAAHLNDLLQNIRI